MNGKDTFQKSLQRIRRSQATNTKTPSRSLMQVGNWRFEENEDGDLVVTNLETQETTIIARKTEIIP